MAISELPTGSRAESQPRNCPFCALGAAALSLANEHGQALRDQFPISLGHTLVVPRLHIGSVFDLAPETQDAIWRLVGEVREQLSAEFHPYGFNVGLNDGLAAGQTVMHAHIHVIPRYTGDVAEPRGGIRWVIPAKAPYWREVP
jgi:diadenosine tetraphosphate (Ap4A) HIT family hydrolase